MRNGPNRASFMWGLSTRNTHIEHLWVKVGSQFVCRWRDCVEFKSNWNAHPMNGQGSFGKSPNDMRLLGQVQHGVYQDDDCEDMHPETIERYYGVFRPQRGEGAGTRNPPDEDTNVEEHIQAEQHPQIRHDAVEVPDHKNPFSDHPVVESTFFPLLTDLIRQDIIPTGYGMLPEEWDEDSYPDVEILYMGRQMKCHESPGFYFFARCVCMDTDTS
ncbi:hypothetical protein B0H14DRAFT_2425156 [Mycena olivaceomarginata]|nr:hypothetical protein B0H14DRAFT_2425156 [Mycena olivaceomarginata]